MKKILFCLFVLCLMLPIANALTASIGNARMVIHTEVEEGEETVIEKSIKVNNVNDVPVKITLELKGDLKDIAEIFDESFILQPDESKEAAFQITLQYGGTYQGQIAVAFEPEEGGNGVGLSSTIIVIADGPEDPNKEKIEEEETEEEEEVEETEETTEESEEETEEEDEVTITFGGVKETDKPTEETGDRKANPLVGILIILIIAGVGAIIFLSVMLLLKKKK